MKKFMYVMLVTLLMGSQATVWAQNKEKKQRQRPTPEQMMQMQTDQMVKLLMLDDATADKFKPVYQNYLKELRECRMMNRKPDMKKEDAKPAEGEGKDAPKPPMMTDEEIAKMLKGQFEQGRKMLDIREKYYNEFSSILSQKQIMKIYRQERKNADKFRKELNRRRGQKPGPHPAPQGPDHHDMHHPR